MAFWRIYYHLVWTTKERESLITPVVEQHLYPYMKGKVKHLGEITHALGGVSDHIHLVASVPPKLSISEFVEHLTCFNMLSFSA